MPFFLPALPSPIHRSALPFLPSLPSMAAYLKGRSVAAHHGKRFLHQIWAAPAISSRARAVHQSSYDKNVDEQARPTVVPDHVIDSRSSDKYWGPHPTTGVFGPTDDGGESASAGSGGSPAVTEGSGTSDAEQTVWFRPQEGVDKAPYA
ncbi:late embryogenesis abundant protein At5g17165-like [Zingiber officinale]|nr:late embryogenesis abundant protein At5g17165-like [Zingiber officinale]